MVQQFAKIAMHDAGAVKSKVGLTLCHTDYDGDMQ